MPRTPSRTGVGPRRRVLLVGALGAVGTTSALAGCSDGATSSAGDAQQAASAKALRRRAAAQSEALLARYDDTLAAHGGLDERLAPLRAAVARHVQVLDDPQASQRPRGNSDSPTPSTSEDKKPHERAEVPTEETAALTELARRERRLAETRTANLLDAPPDLARLLASLAAAGAAHAYLLESEEK